MPFQLRSAEQAEDIATSLAPSFAAGASERDRDRRLPFAELDRLSESGLLGITVPRRFGGPELGARTLGRVVAILAAADPSIAQIPQSHFTFLDALRRGGSRTLQERVYAAILAGARLANAQTERGGKTVRDDTTSLTRDDDGVLRLTGTKFYATGALFADLLAVRAVGQRPGQSVLAYLARDTEGVEVIDDWDGFGQRTTASGTVVFDGAPVADDAVIDFGALLRTPSTYGTRAQLLHAAIDTGIARGALRAGAQAAEQARPWFEADVDQAVDDPLLVARAGELELAVRTAESLLDTAGIAIDRAEASVTPAASSGPGSATPDAVAEAALATAAAKVAAGRAARAAGEALFDFGGTRAAAASSNLSRFWRDARTHTLHDPERWKVQHLGRWALTRQRPPSHTSL